MVVHRRRWSRAYLRGALVSAALLAALLGSYAAPAKAAEWVGDFETGDFSQWAPPGSTWVHALPGRATVVPGVVTQGAHAARFEVRPGDKVNPNWSGELAQVMTLTNEAAGQEWWWAWATFFPPDFPVTYGWCVFTEWHQTGLPGVVQGPAPINFDCKEDQFRLIVRGGDEPNWSQRMFYFPGFQRGIWHQFVFHVRWSPDADGFIELWHNGNLVVPKTHLPTSYRNQGLYPKIGYYRKDGVNTQTGVVYHDDVRRSLTHEGLYQQAVSAPVLEPLVPPAPPIEPEVRFVRSPRLVAYRRLAVAARAIPGSRVVLVVRAKGRIIGARRTWADSSGRVQRRVRMWGWRGERRVTVTLGTHRESEHRRVRTAVRL